MLPALFFLIYLFICVQISFFIYFTFYQEFEDKLEALRANVGNVIEASKLLMVQLEPQATPVIQSEARLLSCDLVHLSQALVKTREQLQVTD